MKLINQNYEIIPQSEGLYGIYKSIEIAGRTCYHSEDKITNDSAKDFTERMIKSGHTAMLEFGTIYLYLPPNSSINFYKYRDNKYSFYRAIREAEIPHPMIHTYVTTNYRVLIENNWEDDLKYMCEPTEEHEKRVHVKFTLPIGISREFCRHRVMSFAEESTRYCNYSKDKFGNEITFIKPCWFDSSLIDDTGHWDANTFYRMPTQSVEEDAFLGTLLSAEKSYFNLLKCGWKPQEARDILPLCIKTELNMCGFIKDWKHFFELRDNNHAHPMAHDLASKLHTKFIENGWIK